MIDATGDSFGTALLLTLLVTALVGVIAWFALGLLRRVLQVRPGTAPSVRHRPAGRLKVAQSVALGTRERVVLLVDDEREYLLGVAAGSVRLLESRAREAAESTPEEDIGTSPRKSVDEEPTIR